MRFLRGYRFLPVLAISALMISCATPVPQATQANQPATQAEQAERQGRYAQAANLWRQAADEGEQMQRDRYLLRTAEAWRAAGQWDKSLPPLQLIDERLLSGAEFSRYALLRAEQALVNADAETASHYLALSRDNLEVAQRSRYLSIESSIVRLRTEPASELLARISRRLSSMSSTDPEQGAELLRSLETVSSGLLQGAAGETPANSMAGAWADLALRIRRSLVSVTGQDAAAAQWASDYPDHAVSEEGFLTLAATYGSRLEVPAQVAILLPMQGSLSAAGQAIRDGILSAYLQRPGESTLKFYESGESPASAVAAYQQAIEDGAEWIIGPVRRESVAAIVQQGQASVPILALNDTDQAVEPFPAGPVYSLSLSQEDEARAIARTMLATGSSAAIMLVSDSSWGSRMEQAFEESFLAGGGMISGASRFPVSESDHSELLRQVLHIDQSQQRKDRLQAMLGLPLSFEPHLRDDFDAFFLSSGPEQARQLRPQLRFFEAGDKPVFAVSRTYSGIRDRDADRDLNGVLLPLTRPQLSNPSDLAASDLSSLRDGRLLNLFALGEDAWNLIPRLALLALDPDLAFPGNIGQLTLTAEGKLFREPSWAVFSGGQPIAWQWAEKTE